MKTLLEIGAIAVPIAFPVLATPIDVVTIEAILLIAISAAAGIGNVLSDR
jgi:hypothetical protein